MKRIKTTVKRQTVNLTKEDDRIAKELQKINNETFSQVISRALQSLYDSYKPQIIYKVVKSDE